MLTPGNPVELMIERPAAGGRMIARHEGQIVFVAGAIPGERVRAQIERVERRLAFARVQAVIEASADRRTAPGDPLCGGCLYAHITLDRQRSIKAQVIADAFARIGRHEIAQPVTVDPSPEQGYRMRARLHVRGTRVGFYREGTHEVCDGAATGQLQPDAWTVAGQLVSALDAAGAPAFSLALAENLPGDQRAIFAELTAPGTLSTPALESLLGAGLTSVSTLSPSGLRLAAGAPKIADPLSTLTGGRATGQLRRTAESFFQGNRFLLPQLVITVMESVLPEGGVLDLYAGVGLFAAALAGTGRENVTAVEGAGATAADLQDNAAGLAAPPDAVVEPVERYLARAGQLPPTIIVDPPRTGLSKPVLQALVGRGGARIVYVSCDPPTMARDARGLLDGGYELQSVRAFDLFPNTPHVEIVGVFDRS
jgi:tRNA/tmRNA/rRNA uracil-C5-methylase (TrmA/RlmC/RlmD family)